MAFTCILSKQRSFSKCIRELWKFPKRSTTFHSLQIKSMAGIPRHSWDTFCVSHNITAVCGVDWRAAQRCEIAPSKDKHRNHKVHGRLLAAEGTRKSAKAIEHNYKYISGRVLIFKIIAMSKIDNTFLFLFLLSTKLYLFPSPLPKPLDLCCSLWRCLSTRLRSKAPSFGLWSGTGSWGSEGAHISGGLRRVAFVASFLPHTIPLVLCQELILAQAFLL